MPRQIHPQHINSRLFKNTGQDGPGVRPAQSTAFAEDIFYPVCPAVSAQNPPHTVSGGQRGGEDPREKDMLPCVLKPEFFHFPCREERPGQFQGIFRGRDRLQGRHQVLFHVIRRGEVRGEPQAVGDPRHFVDVRLVVFSLRGHILPELVPGGMSGLRRLELGAGKDILNSIHRRPQDRLDHGRRRGTSAGALLASIIKFINNSLHFLLDLFYFIQMIFMPRIFFHGRDPLVQDTS